MSEQENDEDYSLGIAVIMIVFAIIFVLFTIPR